jgi:predicted DNA binding CopG/RHH family protein
MDKPMVGEIYSSCLNSIKTEWCVLLALGIWTQTKKDIFEDKGEIEMSRKKPIPDFKTEKEEQEFWATHSSLDYEMELVAENFEIDEMAKTQPVCIRMEKWLIRDLKEIAVEESLPYQTIIKECLKKLVGTRKKRRTIR